MYALINSQIYTGNEILDKHALIISKNIIKHICPIKQLSKSITTYDISGMILTSGFIDLQINGCGGVKFNDDIKSISIETLKKMQNTNQRFGCTSFLPTLITSDDLLMQHAIKVMRVFLKTNKNQALGLHLEGPFLNVKKKGIHDSIFIRSPTQKMINYLCDNCDVIKKITLAPEQVNIKFIQKLKRSGIYVAIGHSNATYKQTRSSFAAGVSFGTHLFNAMPPIYSREPGVVGAILDSPKIYCSIIADGLHVHWSNIKYAKKIKKNHLILVTDATIPAGTHNITHFKFANKIIYCNNNKCVDDHNILSGSTLTMIKAIKNSIQYAGISLDEALRMATLYPAQAIGVDHFLGSIGINKIANLTIFTKEKYQIKKTIINGKIINFT